MLPKVHLQHLIRVSLDAGRPLLHPDYNEPWMEEEEEEEEVEKGEEEEEEPRRRQSVVRRSRCCRVRFSFLCVRPVIEKIAEKVPFFHKNTNQKIVDFFVSPHFWGKKQFSPMEFQFFETFFYSFIIF